MQEFSIDARKAIREGNAVDTRRYAFFIKKKKKKKITLEIRTLDFTKINY
jgi:hypothetical protein